MAALMGMHTKLSPTFATVSVAQMSGLLQLHLNRTALRCTALHWHHRLGLDWMAAWGLAAERASEQASKAVELLRRTPGLPVPLPHPFTHSLPTGFCPLSNFYSLGPPRQFQSRLPTPPPPDLDSVISLFPLSSLTKTQL